MPRELTDCRPLILRFIVGLTMILAGATHAFADGSSWRLIDKSGSVNLVSPGLIKAALTDGDILRPGQRIETGPDGQAIIQQGESFVHIAPNSVLMVPNDQPSDAYTRLMHYLGTIFVEVEKRPEEYFEVVTPFLAAVVKGTKFTVSVNEMAGVVHVTEGIVEVTDLRTGEPILLTAGQTAAAQGEGAGHSLDDPNALPTKLLDEQFVDLNGGTQNASSANLISELIGPGALQTDLGLNGLVSLTSSSVNGLVEGVDVASTLGQVQALPGVETLALGDLSQGLEGGGLGSNLGGIDGLSNDLLGGSGPLGGSPLGGGDLLGGGSPLGGGELLGGGGLGGAAHLPGGGGPTGGINPPLVGGLLGGGGNS